MLWKDQIREWKDEAREDGARDKAVSATKNLLEMNLLTVEQIAAAEQLTVEEVIKIKDSLQK